MPNPTESQGPRPNDHKHHKVCGYHSAMCNECPTVGGLTPEAFEAQRSAVNRAGLSHYKRPTYRHTAKPPWVDFEKQRELVPKETAALENPVEGDPVTVTDDIIASPSSIGLVEKMTTCRITFEDREPERSDSGKAITIHQCEVHLVIITWDES